MSARSVCSGTRPSRYHSVRAISMPFRRPAHMILMPCAPRRIAFWIARFIARRNMIRFSSCCPIESEMSCASISGLRISSMLRPTSPPIILRRSARSVSMSSPFLPMTTPGRALWIVIRAFFAGRSIVILPTEAWASFFFRYSRTLMSSFSVGREMLAVGEPLRRPVAVDGQAEAGRMYFLSHGLLPYLPSPTTTWMWQVCFRIVLPRPLARAVNRRRLSALST